MTARRLGADRSILDQVDAGSLEGWTTSMVEALSRLAGVDAAAVWADEPIADAERLHFLRGGWADFNPDDLEALSGALERGAAIRALREVLKLGPSDRARFGTERVRGAPHKHGYELARRVRSTLGLGDEPISRLYQLLEDRLDVHVAVAPLKTARLEAAAVARPDGEAVVLNANLRLSVLVQRRCLAHELCHLLFDPRDNQVLAILEGAEDDAPHEQRARAFAAELLVPEGGLVDLWGLPERGHDLDEAISRVRHTASLFGAPTELVSNHLTNAGFVVESLRERLISETRGYRVRWTDQPVETLGERARRAVEELRISRGRASELVGAEA